jgi:hypothetical protein
LGRWIEGLAPPRLNELITSVADDGGFREQIVAMGLDYSVGARIASRR